MDCVKVESKPAAPNRILETARHIRHNLFVERANGMARNSTAERRNFASA
jgi:hypothetical protein